MRKLHRLVFVVFATILIISNSKDVLAKTVRSGQKFKITYESDVRQIPAYECIYCHSLFDGLNQIWDTEFECWVRKCPYCQAEDSDISADYAGQYEGTYLDAVTLYTEDPEKVEDAHFIRQYSSNPSNYNFSRSITVKKPGRYYLGYLYTTFDPRNGDSQVEDFYTLNVMGKVIFNPNKGKITKSSSFKWIKHKSKIGKLPKPKRKGYTFLGWYDKKRGGKKVDRNTIVNFKKASKTYYAYWKKKK